MAPQRASLGSGNEATFHRHGEDFSATNSPHGGGSPQPWRRARNRAVRNRGTRALFPSDDHWRRSEGREHRKRVCHQPLAMALRTNPPYALGVPKATPFSGFGFHGHTSTSTDQASTASRHR